MKCIEFYTIAMLQLMLDTLAPRIQLQRPSQQVSIGLLSSKLQEHLSGLVTDAKEWGTFQRDMRYLNGILEVKLFGVWGIGFMDSFPHSNNNPYILVMVDYVPK